MIWEWKVCLYAVDFLVFVGLFGEDLLRWGVSRSTEARIPGGAVTAATRNLCSDLTEGCGRKSTFIAAVSESLGMLPPWNFDS